MAKFNVEVTQWYRATRVIVVKVEAADEESAIEQIESEGAPSFDDPLWKTGWDLQNEEIYLVD